MGLQTSEVRQSHERMLMTAYSIREKLGLIELRATKTFYEPLEVMRRMEKSLEGSLAGSSTRKRGTCFNASAGVVHVM